MSPPWGGSQRSRPLPPPGALLRCRNESTGGRPRRATRGAPRTHPPGARLPVVAPAAIGQGSVAADSFHRRLPAPLRAQLRAPRAAVLGSALARCGPGRGEGGGLYHSPPRGVTPPPALPMAGTRGLRGSGPAGPPPRCWSPAGARLLQPELLIYLFPMCAPRRHGNRSIFSGVTKAPLLSNLPGTEIAKRLSLLLAWGSRIRVPYSGPPPPPPPRDDSSFPAWESSSFHSFQPSTVDCPPSQEWEYPSPEFRRFPPSLRPFPRSPPPPTPAWKSFNHRTPVSPQTVATQPPPYPSENPLLPPSSPTGVPWPRYLAYCGPLGVRRPSSVNTAISRPPLSVYFPLCFSFITTKNPLEKIQLCWLN